MNRVLEARRQARASFGGGPNDDDGPDDDDGDDPKPPKAPRRLRLAMAFPIAAALVIASFINNQPEKYQATATVIVPAVTQCVSTFKDVPNSAPVFAANAFTQCVSTLQDVLTSAPVVDQVSSQTGERKNDLVAGLTATPTTGSRNKILVTYTGPNMKTVQAVVQHAAVDSLDAVLGSQVIASAHALQIADQNLADFATKTGYSFPDVDYKIQEQELKRLNLRLQVAKWARDSARVQGLTAVIEVRNAVLAGLEAQVVQWNSLSQAQTAAQAENDRAKVDLNSAKTSVVLRSVGNVSGVPEILRFGGVAAGVAMLLSLGYIFLVEFLNRREDFSPDAV